MDTQTGKIYTQEEVSTMVGLARKYMKPMDVEPTQRQLARKKVGRNDLCPCGSGKKFKRCCLVPLEVTTP